MQIALLTKAPLNHPTQSITDLLQQQGHDVQIVSTLEQAAEPFDTGWLRMVPGKFKRYTPGYWQAAQLLEERGVPLLNSVRSHALATNKLLCYHLFADRELPQPHTVPAASAELEPGQKYVCKPQFGSRGWGITEVEDYGQLQQTMHQLQAPCVVQPRIRTRRCLRVVCSEHEVFSCYEKRGQPGQLVLSVSQGAQRITTDIPQQAAQYAKEAAAALGAGVVAVDILEDELRSLWVLEANTSFAFDGDDQYLVHSFVQCLLDTAKK